MKFSAIFTPLLPALSMTLGGLSSARAAPHAVLNGFEVVVVYVDAPECACAHSNATSTVSSFVPFGTSTKLPVTPSTTRTTSTTRATSMTSLEISSSVPEYPSIRMTYITSGSSTTTVTAEVYVTITAGTETGGSSTSYALTAISTCTDFPVNESVSYTSGSGLGMQPVATLATPIPSYSSAQAAVVSSTPAPVVSAAPAPIVSAAPTPVVSAAPAPVASSVPAPVASSAPNSAALFGSESGQATFYGGNLAGGMCSFSTYTLPSNVFGTALSDSNWADAEMCGACVSVTGPSGNSITAMVVDQCPGCGLNHLDLFPDAFSTLANPTTGIISVDWKVVPCPVSGPITLHNKSGTSVYWFSMQVLNASKPVKTLEVSTDGGSTWTQTTRQPYNFFENATGFGAGDLTVKVTSVDEDVVIVKDVGVESESSVTAGSNF